MNVVVVVADRQCDVLCIDRVLREHLSPDSAKQTQLYVPAVFAPGSPHALQICDEWTWAAPVASRNSMRELANEFLSSSTPQRHIFFMASSTCTQSMLGAMHELAEQCRRRVSVTSVHMHTRCSRTRDSILKAPIRKASVGNPHGGVMRFVDPRPAELAALSQQQEVSKLVCEQRVERGDLPVRCFTCKAVMTPTPRPGGEKICCFQLRMVHINTMAMKHDVADIKQRYLGEPAMRICGGGGGVHPTNVAAARIFRQLQRQNMSLHRTSSD